MERLTAIAPNGLAYLTKVKQSEQEVESPYPNTLKSIMESFNRLAAYENTGFTPEEIKELEQNYLNDEHEYCGEYGTDDCQFAHRINNLKQELEFWEREAIKSKAQLGEIRILVEKQ